jgi:hypothetical protein
MPGNAALTLSDIRGPTPTVVCQSCDRRGRFSTGELIEKIGDVTLINLLHTLVNCSSRNRRVPMIVAQPVYERA